MQRTSKDEIAAMDYVARTRWLIVPRFRTESGRLDNTRSGTVVITCRTGHFQLWKVTTDDV